MFDHLLQQVTLRVTRHNLFLDFNPVTCLKINSTLQTLSSEPHLFFRHANKPQPQDRVNKYLASALTARVVDREKRDHVNFFTLRFKDSTKEGRVRNNIDLILKDEIKYLTKYIC